MADATQPKSRRRKYGKSKPFRAARRVSVRPCEPAATPEPLESTFSYDFASGCTTTSVCDKQSASMLASLKEMAPLLWSSNYAELFERERAELDQLASLMTVGNLMSNLVMPSTYLRRKNASQENEEKRQAAQTYAHGVTASNMYRQANQQNHTFSCCARSISALASRLPEREWRRQVKRRELLSKKWAHKLLELMMTCRPPATMLATSAVQSYIIDQKYVKKGKPRGQHRAAERVDASGDLIDLISFVFVNVIKTPVPYALASLTPAETLDLKETGPFTRPPANIKIVLHPDAVKASVVEMFQEMLSFVKQMMKRARVTSPRDLDVAKIARSQCGRPQVQCAGATRWDLGPPILGDDEKGCDTKSKKDLVHINDALNAMNDPGSVASQQMAWSISRLPPAMQAAMSVPCAATMPTVVRIVTGDGQTGLSICAAKRRYTPMRALSVPVRWMMSPACPCCPCALTCPTFSMQGPGKLWRHRLCQRRLAHVRSRRHRFQRGVPRQQVRANEAAPE